MVLAKRKLDYFRKRLLQERERILATLKRDDNFKELRESEKMPSDEADQAIALANQTLTYSMRRRELEKIREIDAALGRIEDGSFGVCEDTGDPIEEKRLEVQPWTRVSLEAAREQEALQRQSQAHRVATTPGF